MRNLISQDPFVVENNEISQLNNVQSFCEMNEVLCS